jgi:hypothetical protein
MCECVCAWCGEQWLKKLREADAEWPNKPLGVLFAESEVTTVYEPYLKNHPHQHLVIERCRKQSRSFREFVSMYLSLPPSLCTLSLSLSLSVMYVTKVLIMRAALFSLLQQHKHVAHTLTPLRKSAYAHSPSNQTTNTNYHTLFACL